MAKIDDTVTTWFLGDSTGLVKAANKANAALDSNAKAEAKAALAARRAADARAESFRTALVKPAMELQRTTGILNSGLKLTTLAGGLALAAGKFNELRGEALGARKEMEEFGERYRQFSQANKRPTGAEDATSLMGKLTEAHGLETTLKDRRLALHPEPGFERWRMMNQYNAGFPGHGVEEWQKDINTNKSQLQDNDRTQLNLRKAIDQSFRNEVDLTKEQLRGSTEQLHIREQELARTREIRALEGTVANNDANKSAINERLDLQIQKERELETLRNRQFERDSQAIGIGRQLVSDEQRRENLIQLEADGVDEQLRSGQMKNEEEHQALLLRAEQLKSDLVDAKAAAAVAASQLKLVQQTTTIQRANTSTVAQRLAVEQATLATLREQLAVVSKTNTTRAQGIQATIDQNENVVRLMRQEYGYGKSPGQVQGQITRDRKNRINRDKFDHKQDRDDGLLNISRDASGNILSGFDPILGTRRAPGLGKGRAEQGLHGGINSATGTTGLDTGSLSTEGTTGSMFGGANLFADRHDALVKAGKLDGTSAADKLANPAASGFGDPRAALDKAPIWRNLSPGDRDTLAGARTAINSTARMAGGSGAAFLSASAPKFSAPNTLSQAAIQLSAKKLAQEQATTAAVNRVHQAIQALPDAWSFQ